MSGEYDCTFSSFIDHYVLLLMARYQVSVEDAETDERWTLVAESLQHTLRGPCTPGELKELSLIDASQFGPRICRQRARYLLWHLGKRNSAARKLEKAAGSAAVKRGEDDGPVGFDITQHSIKNEVGKIYEAVRSNLPTTVDALPSGEEDEEPVERDGAAPPIVFKQSEPVDYLKVIEIDTHQFNQTEEERQRQREANIAKDLFLTKVQQMQVEFFRQHRRWVDVPERLLEPPSGGYRDPQGIKENEEEEREYLLHALKASQEGGSGVNTADRNKAALNAFRQSVQNSASRPSRPSRVTDEDIEKMYKTSTIVPGTNAAVAPASVARKTDFSSAAQTPARAARGAPSASPPSTNRKNRWQIVEYDDAEEANDDEDESDDSESSSD